MREIKFRAWDERGNKMYQVKDLGVGKNSWEKTAVNYNEQLKTGYCKFYPGEVEVMQYTGLKDKNEKEIYEGDILREYGNEIDDWIVSYEDGKFIGTCDDICEDLYEIADLEVIGNIYENPELLEGE